MIKPAIGRIVWYYNANYREGEQPWAGIICFVWEDDLVNLSVTDENGLSKPKQSVVLYQGDGPKPELPYCEWMPYQKG